MRDSASVVIVGASAAGLMTAIHAARAGARDVLLLDGARKLGAKILIAGGGRCNVTHDTVDETAFAGSSRNAIRKVLRRYDVDATTAFFQELGVVLKREETGKLFPVTDSARTVLNALLNEARGRGVEIAFPRRVKRIERNGDGFRVSGTWGAVTAPRVVLATGGRSIPKSGSDGFGYQLARALGHSLTAIVTPGLVPLRLADGHFLRELSGVTVDTTLELRSDTGKRLVSFTDSTLFTHFGLSGPSVLDISRYFLQGGNAALLFLNLLPGMSPADLEGVLRSSGGKSVATVLQQHLPERLARALCDRAHVDPTVQAGQLRRDPRRTLAATVCELKLPVTGSRGYNFAEVTAGGVPLSEIRLETMESRVCPGLHLVGEICDVDGRIGGYNFQWAWSSGFVAGTALGETE
jgi:predicted Rossmann fold flavoprotein